MWGIVLLLYLVTGGHQISISEFSVPHAVEVGENITLKCQYELSPGESDKALFVKWWKTTKGNDSTDYRHQLYQRIAGLSPEVTSKDIKIIEDDDIFLENVEVGDSGIYECEVSNIDEVRKHAELVVYKLGSGPELNISINGSSDESGANLDGYVPVNVTCRADDVSPEPSLIITVNGNAVEGEKILEEYDEGGYDITQTVILNGENVDEANIACQLVIEYLNITHPHTEMQTFYVDPTERSTTEDADDVSTTEASADPLQSTRDSGFVPTSCILLVIVTFLFHLLFMN